MAHKKKKHSRKKISERGTLTAYPAPVIGILCTLFFVPMLVLSVRTGLWFGVIVFGIFAVMSIYLILFISWKIDYDSNGFTYRNIFRISKRYSYSQITEIHHGKSRWIQVGKERIHLEETIGSKYFMMVAGRYAKQAKHTTAADSKLFNGNVENPGEFIFVSILFPVLTICAIIFAQIAFRPVPLEKLEHLSVKITDYAQEYDDNQNPRLKLIPETGAEYFNLYEYNNQPIDTESLIQDIEKGSQFEIYYKDSEKIIRQISSGKIYLCVDDFNAEEKETQFTCTMIFTIILVLELIFIAVQNHVLSHADRYPRAVKLFVKEDYLVKK